MLHARHVRCTRSEPYLHGQGNHVSLDNSANRVGLSFHAEASAHVPDDLLLQLVGQGRENGAHQPSRPSTARMRLDHTSRHVKTQAQVLPTEVARSGGSATTSFRAIRRTARHLPLRVKKRTRSEHGGGGKGRRTRGARPVRRRLRCGSFHGELTSMQITRQGAACSARRTDPDPESRRPSLDSPNVSAGHDAPLATPAHQLERRVHTDKRDRDAGKRGCRDLKGRKPR